MPADLLCHYGQGSTYALANISVDDTETTVMQTCLHVLSLLLHRVKLKTFLIVTGTDGTPDNFSFIIWTACSLLVGWWSFVKDKCRMYKEQEFKSLI